MNVGPIYMSFCHRAFLISSIFLFILLNVLQCVIESNLCILLLVSLFNFTYAYAVNESRLVFWFSNFNLLVRNLTFVFLFSVMKPFMKLWLFRTPGTCPLCADVFLNEITHTNLRNWNPQFVCDFSGIRICLLMTKIVASLICDICDILY